MPAIYNIATLTEILTFNQDVFGGIIKYFRKIIENTYTLTLFVMYFTPCNTERHIRHLELSDPMDPCLPYLRYT